MSRNTPQVSVIVPVFNSELYLREALSSVLAQSFGALEILVIDDGSATNACQDLVAQAQRDAGREIRYVRQENRGPAAARNRGLAEARGELIAFLDSDDLYEPGKLTLQVDIMRRVPHDYAFVTGGYVRFAYDAPSDRQVVVPASLDGAIYPALLQPGGAVPWAPAAHLFRRAALAAMGGYDCALRYGEDKELLIRLARMCKGVTHREIVYRTRLHPRSVSASIEPTRLLSDTAYLIQSLRAADPRLPDRLLRQMQRQALLSAATLALRYPGNHARFASLLRAAVRHGGCGTRWLSWRAVWAGYAAMMVKRLRRTGIER